MNENRRGVAAPTGGFEDVQLNAADRQPTPGVTVSVLQTAPAVIARVLQPPPTVVAPVSQPAPAAGHGSLPRSLVSLVRNMEIVERNDDTSAVNAVGSAGGSGLPPADPNPPVCFYVGYSARRFPLKPGTKSGRITLSNLLSQS